MSGSMTDKVALSVRTPAVAAPDSRTFSVNAALFTITGLSLAPLIVRITVVSVRSSVWTVKLSVSVPESVSPSTVLFALFSV